MASFTSYCESVTRSERPAVVFLVMVTSYDEEFPDEGHVNITLPDMYLVDIFCDWATKQTIIITSSNFVWTPFYVKNRNNCEYNIDINAGYKTTQQSLSLCVFNISSFPIANTLIYVLLHCNYRLYKKPRSCSRVSMIEIRDSKCEVRDSKKKKPDSISDITNQFIINNISAQRKTIHHACLIYE